jgi:hypothetical protein
MGGRFQIGIPGRLHRNPQKPTTGEKGGTAIAPAVVSAGEIRDFIPPPTREQLMAGSANLRRVYKVEY